MACTSVPQTVTVQVYDSLSVQLDAPALICGGAFAEVESSCLRRGEVVPGMGSIGPGKM